MFCGKFGTKINDGDSFCTNCGAEVIEVENQIDEELTFDDNGNEGFEFDMNEDDVKNINSEVDEIIDLKKDISKMSLKELKLKKEELLNENIKLNNELRQLPDQYHVPAGTLDPAESITISIFHNEKTIEDVKKLIDDIVNDICNFDEIKNKINKMNRGELLNELKKLQAENEVLDRNIEKEKIKAEYNDKLIEIVKENGREWDR